jgi:hypothetical protein
MGSDEEQYLALLAEAMGDFNRKFEIHLALADLYFRDPDTQPKAIEQYDAALAVAVEQGDPTREGMVCMGKGFALINSGTPPSRYWLAVVGSLTCRFAARQARRNTSPWPLCRWNGRSSWRTRAGTWRRPGSWRP